MCGNKDISRKLNPEQIDGLSRAAQDPRGKRREALSRTRTVSPYTFGQTPVVDPGKMRSLAVLHETLATELSRYLSVSLRNSIEVSKSSLKSISFSEFLQPFPEPAYVASVIAQPPEAVAVLTLEMEVVFPTLDLLLGGEGKAEAPTRDITEIEEEVLESVIRIICRELEKAFHPLLQLTFRLDRRQQRAQVMRLIPPVDKVLAFTFEVGMGERLGQFGLALPSSVSGRLLRKVEEEETAQPVRRSEHAPRLRELLRGCSLSVEMQLPPTPIRGRDLLALRPGHSLALQHRISDPVPVWIAGQKLFLAFPVRRGKARAAMVDRRIHDSLSPREDHR
jgi:flagellar motor switch protein FliM